MGGVLSHTILGLISAGFIFYFFKKLEFSFAVFVGNTIVDGFKFVFTGLMQGTLNIFNISYDKTFWFWAEITNNIVNWFSLGFAITTLLLFLYHHHYIRKKTMFEYDEVLWVFLFGVILHLIWDLIYIENNKWF